MAWVRLLYQVADAMIEADGDLRIHIAGLCYDTQHSEAIPFAVDMPEETPGALA